MKKVLVTLAFAMLASFAVNAQNKTTVVKDETTTKNTSTVPQKVHNTFSKDKHYNGKKRTHTKVVKQADGSMNASKTTTKTTVQQ